MNKNGLFWLFSMTASILFSMGLSVSVFAPRTAVAEGHSWQQPTDETGEIGIRDKYGEAGKRYVAQFVVTGVDGRRYVASREVDGDAWGGVTFPGDFRGASDAQPGQYSWVAQVDGRTVIGGQFAYPQPAR